MTDVDSIKTAYRSAGLSLFPCKGKDAPSLDRWKEPQWRGWKTTGIDQYTNKDLDEIYGVALPSNIVVIDFDPRRGESQLKDLWAQLELPRAETFIVKTGSGGFHLYYRKPEDIYVRGKVPGFPAIDVKTGGGFVIAAGSVHNTGNTYEIIRGSIDDIAEIPEQLLSLIAFDWDDVASRGSDTEQDTDQNRKRFVNYVLNREASGTYAIACYGRELGLSAESIYAVLAEHYNPRRVEPKTERELRSKIAHAFSYAQESQGSADVSLRFDSLKNDELVQNSLAAAANEKIQFSFRVDKNGNKELENTINNIIGFLRLVPIPNDPNPLYKLFRLNTFINKIEFTRPAPWHNPDFPPRYLDDRDLYKLKEYFAVEKKLKPTTETIREAIEAVAYDNQYHPLRDWLKTLKWDGVERVDTFLSVYAGSPDTPLIREWAKNTLIAAVARVMKPGCKHDSMLVLEGPQDSGKSTFVAVLGGDYYADVKIDVEHKDTIQNMQGRWVLEASEMEFMRRSDVGALKRFLTITTDVIRLSHARYTSELPRQSIFIGTVNPNGCGYLIDPTGNRRFWPVQTTTIDIPKLQADREQLWAEAYHRYSQGEPWWIIDPELKAMANGEQKKRVAVDLWEEIIGQYLDRELVPQPLTTSGIAQYALNIPSRALGRNETLRISAVLKSMGYESKNVRDDNNKQVRAWVKIDETDPTIGLI